MKKCFALLPVLLLTCSLAVPQAGAASRSGQISMEFDLSGHASGEEARLWIPYPVSDNDQKIGEIRLSGDYAEAAVYTDRTFGTPMLFARWDEGAKSRRLNLSFAVERQEVIRRDFPTREAAWDPADYALYLAPTRLGPIDGQVKKLADTITAGQTTVLGKARAIYDWIIENMYRDPETRGCGSGDVCVLLERPGGKCADISSVYIALARAAGVPAREVFGIRQGKEPVQDISGWQHCWAEFYLPGYGWVPVDPADVRKKMLVENLKLSDAAVAEARAYFWGGVDPYRVKLGEGRDLILNPPQQGEPVNYLMYPFAQMGGKTLDWLDPATFKYMITYREN
ncbi:transglutaminase family protein [Desulfuromonas sp. TF]|uniref:transglutaminase-like domain-containing protein n=1 Tax=Desulfuromonas sp. TF TaxID=1232410 RepID=UPI00041A717C|nr:transglutaminase domain-containing protein [Desulfuromonas sp. TF]